MPEPIWTLPFISRKGKWDIDGIPLERLVGPAVVIDVRASVAADRDYRISLEDIERWEVRYGPYRPARSS